jgi:RES domain-containing protein
LPETTGSVRLYRLIKQKYARHTLAGRGGLESDGRWHTAGRPVVYLASSEALAVLEVRVHVGSIVPTDPYTLLTIDWPARLVEVLPRKRWPRHWNAVPFVVATQRLGDRWQAEGRSATLRVPSVHSGSDFNVLVNPSQPDARRARIVSRSRYEFDDRAASI